MFAKALSTFSVLAIALSLPYQAFGHAVITPAIGLNRDPIRADAVRTSATEPCGAGTDIASALPGSTAAQVVDGLFHLNITNFNGGQDGSTQIAQGLIDTTGTGNAFPDGQVIMTVNGELAPTTDSTVALAGSLPEGTACAGGSDGASCLVAFTTQGGFGNCVLISQAGSA